VRELAKPASSRKPYGLASEKLSIVFLYSTVSTPNENPFSTKSIAFPRKNFTEIMSNQHQHVTPQQHTQRLTVILNNTRFDPNRPQRTLEAERARIHQMRQVQQSTMQNVLENNRSMQQQQNQPQAYQPLVYVTRSTFLDGLFKVQLGDKSLLLSEHNVTNLYGIDLTVLKHEDAMQRRAQAYARNGGVQYNQQQHYNQQPQYETNSDGYSFYGYESHQIHPDYGMRRQNQPYQLC
jgi:hypothetical protein